MVRIFIFIFFIHFAKLVICLLTDKFSKLAHNHFSAFRPDVGPEFPHERPKPLVRVAALILLLQLAKVP